jgi:cobalt/nickel transport system permease protein
LLGSRAPQAAVFLGGALSVLVSGVLALMELSFSGIRLPSAVLLLAAGLFGVSAILEGAITVGVLRALGRMNPDWVRKPEQGRRALRALAIATVMIAALGFVVASASPDTLERLASRIGIDDREVTIAEGPLADYRLAGIEWEALARGAAGLTGIALVSAACVAAARLFQRSS